MQAADGVDLEAAQQCVSAHPLKGTAARVVVVDGVVAPELSSWGGLPEGVYLGSVAGALGSCLQHMVRAQQHRPLLLLALVSPSHGLCAAVVMLCESAAAASKLL